jgi:hypothetical protein
MPLFRRKDGDLVRDVPPYRRMMPVLLPTRTESTVFFEQRVDVGPALEYVARHNAASPNKITVFHLVLYAIVQTLAERPRLNRFTMGRRLYQRRGIWVSYSAKRAFDDSSPVFVAKRLFEPTWTFDEVVEAVRGGVSEGRSDKPTATDKELGILLKLPLFLLGFLVRLLRVLDRWNLLPQAFIRNDPFYASILVANLGSLKMDAAFHHNFDYGTMPIFLAIGQVEDAVVVRPDGSLGARKQVLLRWTYDERIEDGLYCARALDLLKARIEDPTAGMVPGPSQKGEANAQARA